MTAVTLLATISIALVASPQDSASFRLAPEALLPSKVVATWPEKSFLENILALSSGDLLVNSYFDGIVYRFRRDGTYSVFAKTGGKIAGIAQIPRGGYVVSGWTDQGAACVYEVSKDGTAVKPYTITGGMFPNGVEHLKGDRFLIADSYAGLIWEYRASNHKATVWKEDAAFARANLKDQTPGINGIRIHGRYLYVSNTNAHKFYRIRLGQGLTPVGGPELLASDVNFDDFAIDKMGNVYATTHILNSVQKLTPKGELTTIAGLAQGLAGSTSAVFGRTRSTRNVLYVTTNGGLSSPPPGGAQPGKVVQITIK